MAKVTVKLFGVLRVDTKLAVQELEIEKLEDAFEPINKKVQEIYEANKQNNPSLEKPDRIEFKDMLVFINGERCSKKKRKMADGDEVWILSPASGG